VPLDHHDLRHPTQASKLGRLHKQLPISWPKSLLPPHLARNKWCPLFEVV
jgi:hypothetical protein